jgi:hypothetical protein
VQIYQSFGYYLIQIFPEVQTNRGDNLQKSKVVKNRFGVVLQNSTKENRKEIQKGKENG